MQMDKVTDLIFKRLKKIRKGSAANLRTVGTMNVVSEVAVT